jgi:hypothetical protein
VTARPYTPDPAELARLLAGDQVELRLPLDPQPPGVIGWHRLFDEWRGRRPGAVASCWSGYCPLGSPGDLLWCREVHAFQTHIGERHADDCDDLDCAGYSAGCDVRIRYLAESTPLDKGPAHHAVWRPAGELPEWAARLWLRVESVRVAKLEGLWTWLVRFEVASTAARP